MTPPLYFENTDPTQSALLRDVDVLLAPGARLQGATLGGPATIGKGSKLGPDATVGRYFGLNEYTVVQNADIGSFCTFGAHVIVGPFDHPTDWLSIHEFQYEPHSYGFVPEYAEMERRPNVWERERVTIGHDVWIGSKAMVLDGAVIGTGAIIGAGAVVTGEIPPYAVAVGVPARVMRYRFTPEIIEELLESRWWERELSELTGLPFHKVELCLALMKRRSWEGKTYDRR